MRKSNKFDDPAPEVAHSGQDSVTVTRTAAIIQKDQIQLKDRIGEGAHGAVHEGTWFNVHGSVSGGRGRGGGECVHVCVCMCV